MKILLIQPPVRDFYFTAKRSIPYGLISIASALRKSGFEVELIDGLATSKSKVIDLPFEMSYLEEFYENEDSTPFALFNKYRYYGYSFEHIGNLVEKSNASIVGISSLFTAYSKEAMETAAVVRKKLPDCTIVLGGHHPTNMPEKVIAEAVVDFVIRGEGEIAFPELALALQNNKPVDKIKGLVFRNNKGLLHLNEPVLIENPDDYPLPAFDLVNHKFYSRKNGASMVVTASRGCPMKCTYCCVADPLSKYRKRSVDAVFNEIKKSVDEYGVRFIDFEDENLTLDKKWFYRLLTKIRKHFAHLDIELRAMNGLFPPSIDEEMISVMKNSGFKIVNLSLCTLSKKQLKRFNRPDVRDALENVVGYSKKYGMEAVCYIIAGAPGQIALETIDDLLYLYKIGAVTGVSVFYPAPGSVEFKRTEEKGLLPDSCGLMRSSVIPVSDTTTRLESVTILRLGRILNFMKKLKDQGKRLKPVAFDSSLLKACCDRNQLGFHLMQAFLYDGEIRGIKSDGEIYFHNIARNLTGKLIQGLGYHKKL